MARIRTVKPDFFTHPSITPLSIPARLLLLSLLTQADDEGRLYDQGAKIRGLAFGDEDRVNIGALLAELAEHRRILRYEIGGRDCIEITGFNEHQRISHPTGSVIPSPGLFAEPSANGQGVLTEGVYRERKGKEGKGKEGKGSGEAAPRFDEFWNVYPIHRDRREAERAWAKAVKRADPDTIIAGAERYRDDPNRDPSKTKYAQGWLNGDRWEDEPTPKAPEMGSDEWAAANAWRLNDA